MTALLSPDSSYLRYAAATLAGILMTITIFLLMSRLIGSGPINVRTPDFIPTVDIYQPPAEAPPPKTKTEPEPATSDAPPAMEPVMTPLKISAPAPSTTIKMAGPAIPTFEPTFNDISLPSGNGSTFGSGIASGEDMETWTPPGDDKLAKKIAEANAKGKAGYREILPSATRQPNIPEYAWKNKINGWVLVAFTVNAQGTVENVRVLDSSPRGVFDKNVIESVKHWIYNPVDLGGKKVKVQMTQRIELFWKDYPNNNPQLQH